MGTEKFDGSTLELTWKIIAIAVGYAAEMNREIECVHIHSDGHCSTGTDWWTTTPSEPGDVVMTYHPDRALDVVDCFEPVP